MKSRKNIYAVLLILCFTLSACQNNAKTDMLKYKQVDTRVLKTQNKSIYHSYTGIVMAKHIKKYAFQMGGLVQALSVDIGDKVVVGDLLVSLNTDKQDIAVNSANQDSNKAYNQYVKAVEAHDFLSDELRKLKELLDRDVIPRTQYDELELKVKLAKQELEQAQAQYEQSRLKAKLDQTQRADASLYSDINGQVIQTLFSEGEVIVPGHPIVIVGSSDKEVFIGVNSEEARSIKKGDAAIIEVSGVKYDGVVDTISPVIDSKLQNHNVSVNFKDQNLDVFQGELADVKVFDSEEEGIWIEIAYIQNDGRDYVYVAEPVEQAIREHMADKVESTSSDSDEKSKEIDESKDKSLDKPKYRSIKRYIEIMSFDGEYVLVEGVKTGELLITSSLNALTDGYLVDINVE